MSRLSLKLRLTLVLSALVGLLGLVGLTSYLTHRQIRSEVAVFSSHRDVNLSDFDLSNNLLELEGSWDPSGVFLARDVEVYPGRRRPKLRGEVQSLDLAARTMVMYGQEIHLPGDLDLSGLAAGGRAEITCDVENGRWTLEKLSTKNVKASDKIKASPSAWHVDGSAPETLDINGIRVSLFAHQEADVTSALQDIETATALSLCLYEMQAEAYALVGTPESPGAQPKPSPEPLLTTRKELESHLSRGDSKDGASRGAGRMLVALRNQLPALDQRLSAFIYACDEDLLAGRSELRAQLVPFLESEFKARINNYLREAQDELGDRARSIEAKTETTTRVALAICLLAILIATVLGYLLLRSIRQPLYDLEQAARRVSEGDLSTRVEVHSPDELGALAEAFNRMSETLASTTVSIDNLQNILDSMAGALFLLTAELKIIFVNDAGAQLLDHDADSLAGAAFATLCNPAQLGGLFSGIDSGKHVAEVELIAADGEPVLVSFSAAELHSRDGKLQGYVCVAQDLRDQKRREDQVRSSLEEKELLLREVHHRVKNNMQVISSLLAMQQDAAEDPSVVQCLEQGQARIRSMALIHEHLYQSVDLAQADSAAYLGLLVSHIARAFGREKKITLHDDFESLSLGLEQGLALGLIVNELLVNSYLHAFRSEASGSIWVHLHADGSGHAELLVRDDGAGASEGSVKPNPEGLGLSLVQTLVMQLGGESIVEHDGGLSTCIRFPYQSQAGSPV